MQKIATSAPSEVVELVKEALAGGHVVILPATARGVEDAVLAPDTGTSLVMTLCSRFSLQRAEGRALAALLEHEHVSKEKLYDAMRPAGRSALKGRSANVAICSLRKKLPGDLQITTLHGLGFAIDRETRARVRALLAEIDRANAATIPKPDAAP